MNDDLFPTPWKIEGGTIMDAKGQPLFYASSALYLHPDVLATVALAPQMHDALQEARVGLLSSMRTLRNTLRLLAELAAETRTPELAKATAKMAAHMENIRE